MYRIFLLYSVAWLKIPLTLDAKLYVIKRDPTLDDILLKFLFWIAHPTKHKLILKFALFRSTMFGSRNFDFFILFLSFLTKLAWNVVILELCNSFSHNFFFSKDKTVKNLHISTIVAKFFTKCCFSIIYYLIFSFLNWMSSLDSDALILNSRFFSLYFYISYLLAFVSTYLAISFSLYLISF